MTEPVNSSLASQSGAAASLSEPSWLVTLRTIGQIAVQVLAPLAAALLLYFTLPLSISLIVIPIATVITAIAIHRLFTKEESQPEEPVLRLPEPVVPPLASVPCGLTNVGVVDCWLNSILQITRVDADMRKWFTEVPDQLDVHVGQFKYFTQELLENLPEVLPQQAYGDLDANDTIGRARIDAYANGIRNKSEVEKQNIFRYLRFLRQRRGAEAQSIAGALVEFRTFMQCYDLSAQGKCSQLVWMPFEEGRPRQPYSTANLRIALSRLNGGISPNCKQQCANQGMSVILSELLPKDCRLVTELWSHRKSGGVIKQEFLSWIALHAKDSDRNIGDLLDQYFGDQPLCESEQEILVKTQNRISHAPKSLWIELKRHSIFWPDAEHRKNEIVEIQKTIEIQTVEGGSVEYKINGCIVHLGTLAGGHYISYRIEKDDQNKDVWYEMNDSRVTLKTEAEMHKILSEKGYMFHYSKIEE